MLNRLRQWHGLKTDCSTITSGVHSVQTVPVRQTFEGLGLVKRMVDSGKSNILIVTPSKQVCESWVKTGNNKSFFGLDVKLLPDTKTAGEGIVTTTYSNLALNKELVNRDWD